MWIILGGITILCGKPVMIDSWMEDVNLFELSSTFGYPAWSIDSATVQLQFRTDGKFLKLSSIRPYSLCSLGH